MAFFLVSCSLMAGHPFDTIKTSIQTQSQDRVGEKTLYRGPLHCATTLIGREGFSGLYKGIAAPLVQNALGVALLFGAMDWLREAFGASIFAPHRFSFPFLRLCCVVDQILLVMILQIYLGLLPYWHSGVCSLLPT